MTPFARFTTALDAYCAQVQRHGDKASQRAVVRAYDDAVNAYQPLREALAAMAEAFTRHPGNDDERRHALTLARAALALTAKETDRE